MKNVACIISSSVYKHYFGQETLDMALALSLINENTGFFFIEDGIFQILKNNNTQKKIIIKNNFNMLKSYGVTQFYSSVKFFRQRGVELTHPLWINLLILDHLNFRSKIDSFDFVLKF